MVRRFVAAALMLLLSPAVSPAQIPASPVPLYPGAAAPPRSFEMEPLPPVAPAPEIARSANAPPSAGLAPPPAGAPALPATSPGERVFCEQPVAVQLDDTGAVPERFRPFVGVWSDASWTPLMCAALIVERVTPDGTATIAYVFGPMAANPRGAKGVAGGVLHGTGIIRDGELRFQNSDGSQFAFRPVYADLGGLLTTPQGQSHEAIFKKTP